MNTNALYAAIEQDNTDSTLKITFSRQPEEQVCVEFPLKQHDDFSPDDWTFPPDGVPISIVSAESQHDWLNSQLTGQKIKPGSFVRAIQELDYLASCLASFSSVDLLRFQAAAGHPGIQTIPDLVTASGNLNHYTFIPTKDSRELGEYVVRQELAHYPEDVIPLLDFEKVGNKFESSHCLYSLPQGYVMRDDRHLTYQYNGWDLPKLPGNAVFRITLNDDAGHPVTYSLPTSKNEIQQIQAQMPTDSISALDIKMDQELKEVLPDQGTLEELNELAGVINSMNSHDYRTALAAMEVERPKTLATAITYARSAHWYELLPHEVDCPEEYAHHVLNDSAREIYIEDEITPFVDYKKYGEYKMIADGVRDTNQGWLIRIGDPFLPEMAVRPEQQPETQNDLSMGGM